MLDFWFDFISPYAFLAWLRVRDLAAAHGATLRPRPVLFAALLDHHGQLGPAEIPSKREHTFNLPRGPAGIDAALRRHGARGFASAPDAKGRTRRASQPAIPRHALRLTVA